MFSKLISSAEPKHQKVSVVQSEDRSTEQKRFPEDFPVEIINEIFSLLELKDHFYCAQVSKTFRNICKDDSVQNSMCERININGKNVSSRHLHSVFGEKCKNVHFRFATLERDLILSKITKVKYIDSEDGETKETVDVGVASQEGAHFIFHSYLYTLNLKSSAIEKISRQIGHPLKSLDLSDFRIFGLNLDKCEANCEVLEYLIGSCHCLEEVSLQDLNLSTNVIKKLCLQNGRTLKILDLCNFRILDLKSIKHIVSYCVELTELNLESTSITGNQSLYLVRNLTPKLEKINIGVKYLTDEHVKALVKRCNKLKELKLNYSGPITDNAITSIKDELKNTLETLDLPRCKEISYSKLLELQEMPRLMNLSIDWPIKIIQRLKIELPNFNINKWP